MMKIYLSPPGRATVKVMVWSSLWASMVPPWRVTISLAMAKPSPVPPVSEDRALSAR